MSRPGTTNETHVDMSHDSAAAAYRFDRFELQPGHQRLLQDGRAVAVGPRAFELLVALVEQAGDLVTKDELLARVWPKVVVEENNLQVQVSSLRKILGPAAIATVPGRGYRFTLPLEGLSPAASASPPRPRHNLPRPLTSFVGRENDLAEQARTLEQARLMTLTGVGGCGKTRLAIELAQRLLSSFADGVVFVDLAAVAEPERLALSVATALDVRETVGTPIEETLTRLLAERETLLVLDNCEHLLASCAALAEHLLGAAPRLRVLVTSREGLGVAGERVVPVRSLAFPPREVRDAQALGAFEAVSLFVDRAQQVSPGFSLGADSASAVGEICRRLDGIPLALELAAARLKLLSIEQIRQRLDDRFRLLTGNARAIPRHQTLVAVLQWSYEHLAAPEQQWLQRLSVFVGGWTLEAATAIAGEGCDEFETLARLDRLVDSSLVVVDHTAAEGARYSMLETVRQYALDRLNESGPGEALRERHLEYFVDLARSAHPHLFGRDAERWYRRIDLELGNLLAAHAWCDRSPRGAELGLELASSARIYWINRGLFALGHQMYAEALSRKGTEARSTQRARALFALGQHCSFGGRFGDAVAPLEEALAIAREQADHEYVTYTLDSLARSLAAEGESGRALRCVEECLSVAEAHGIGRGSASAYITKSAIHRSRGDADAAVAALELCLQVCDLADLHTIHVARIDMARAEISRGGFERARQCLIEGIRLLDELDSPFHTAAVIGFASLLAAARSDWPRAALMQAVFETTMQQMGGNHPREGAPNLVRLRLDDAERLYVTRVQAMLSKDEFEAARDAARRLSLDEALGDTMEWLETLPAPAPAPADATTIGRQSRPPTGY
jgi:non-specific serine/threonine protein kinase